MNLYGFVGNDSVARWDKNGLAGYYTLTEDSVSDGVDPNAIDSMKVPRSANGYFCEYTKDESEPCEYKDIKIIQVLFATGQIKKAIRVDSAHPEKGPGYIEGGGYGFPETGTIFDAPGDGDEDLKGTWFVEVCAYCHQGTPKEKLLGCVRFNFDNKMRTVEPRQDNAKKDGINKYTVPAFTPETRLFMEGWKKWKSR